MSSTITSTSVTHAPVRAASWVAPASTCVATARVAKAMWSKQLPLAPDAAAAAMANRNKGAVGAQGFWDPV